MIKLNDRSGNENPRSFHRGRTLELILQKSLASLGLASRVVSRGFRQEREMMGTGLPDRVGRAIFSKVISCGVASHLSTFRVAKIIIYVYCDRYSLRASRSSLSFDKIH